MTARQGLQLDAQNPWPGLATYDETAKDFFYGRAAEEDELVRMIGLAPLTVLYGKSGLGKSSLLQAGLFPKLRMHYFLPVHIRLDVANAAITPFIDQAAYWFQEAMHAMNADFPSFEQNENLWRYLHRRDLEIWSRDNRLMTPVFVFDQFEEVFAESNPELPVPRILCRDLADLIENKLPDKLVSADSGKQSIEKLDVLSQRYRVVLSFREDYLPALKNWERDVSSLLKNWLQLKPMSRDRAIEAVERSGVAIVAPGVAKEIVDFVGNLDKDKPSGETVIEPVLLSLCCYQLNIHRQNEKLRYIDSALLRKVGREILESYYQNALAGMPRSVARFIETKLIQGDRYRSSYPVSLALEEKCISENQLAVLTDRHRLLRVDQQLGTARIELIHDRLVSVVRDSRNRREQDKRIARVWVIASSLLVLVVSLSGWQKWESMTQTERLREDKARLQETFEATLMRTTGSVAVLPTSRSQQIYLQIRESKQYEPAGRIQKILIEQKFDVPGIETLKIGPSTTEVRYFKQDDAGQAEKIADLLLQQQIPDVAAKYVAGFEDSKKLRPGHFEIWFAPDAFQ